LTSSPSRKPLILATLLCLGATSAVAQPSANDIEAQLMRCWAPPSADAAASVRPITFALVLGPDGSLLDASTDYSPLNAVERTLRDAAVRALRRCLPVRPPAAPYEEWKDTPVTFDVVRPRRSPNIRLPD
jgi:colicin import membrane protein